MTQSKFLKISCPRCQTKHITFGKATLRVKCKSCNRLLLKNKGGKAKIHALIRRVI